MSNKYGNFRKTKSAIYWYITTITSFAFFFISNVINYFDISKRIEFDKNISSLMGVAFSLTISTLIDTLIYLSDKRSNKVDVVFFSKIFGIVSIIVQLVMYTICNTVNQLDHKTGLVISSLIITIAAFIYGYNIKKIIWRRKLE